MRAPRRRIHLGRSAERLHNGRKSELFWIQEYSRFLAIPHQLQTSKQTPTGRIDPLEIH